MFRHIHDDVVWQKIQPTRKSILEYLTTLRNPQWNQNSLCDGWRVRDVLAHLILEYHYTVSNSGLDFIKSGFQINTFLRQTAINLGNRPVNELMDMFRAMEHERHKPKSIPAINALVDLLIHEQDIRIPLNHPKDIDSELLNLIFTHWEPVEFNLGEKITGVSGRTKGLRFVIDDLHMIRGTGDLDVIGNAQDILLAISGRKVTLDRLSGQGAAILRDRS